MKNTNLARKESTTGIIFRYGIILAICIILLNSLYIHFLQGSLERGQVFSLLAGLALFSLMFFFAGTKNFKVRLSVSVSLLMMTLGGIILLQAVLTGMKTSRETGFLFFTILIFICYSIPRFPWRAALTTALLMTSIYVIGASFIAAPASSIFGTVWGVFSNDGWLLAIVHATGLFVAKTRDFLFSRDDKFYSDLVSAHRSLRFSYETVQKDLQMAKIIQKNILPPEDLSIDGLDIKTHYLPFREVSGDIYDINEITPGYVRIFLADAPGHGIQAALITMIIRSEYEKLKRDAGDPSEVLKALNRNFIQSYESLENYFSSIIVDIDITNKKLLYASAGHPEQVLIQNKKLVPLPATGILAGDLFESDYKLEEFIFNHGDKVLLFTDGLYERMNEDMEKSVKRVILSALESSRMYHVRDLFASLIETLEKYHRDRVLDSRHDDITLIAIELKDGES